MISRREGDISDGSVFLKIFNTFGGDFSNNAEALLASGGCERSGDPNEEVEESGKQVHACFPE